MRAACPPKHPPQTRAQPGTMGIPVSNSGLLEASKIDLSHQEMDRLVSELEGIWGSFAKDHEGNPTGVEWLPVDHVGQALCTDLGYEDMPEFEDALKGSFESFLDNLPNVIKEVRNGRAFFQIRPDPKQEEWVDCVMTCACACMCWRVCGGGVQGGQKYTSHIDSIYNHIASAIFNLGNYVRQAGGSLTEDQKSKIMDTVIALNVFLDVPEPFTWILHDPSGSSEFKPMDGVDAGAAAGGGAAEAGGAEQS
ncbi:MAG: hypothetical protein J3K34DRAFT_134373 [Monoraphidium minutum]|nr:MAG: hypothetical protein J3K34DRAFT_134373 [Monoraphidium minutum]